MSHDTIYMSLATIPERQAGLEHILKVLLPQVDHMFICLNGYPENFVIDDPKVTTRHFTPENQIYDHGKFLWASNLQGYHLTIDDDIEYPEDYVQYMVDGVDRYRRRALIALHGILLPKGRENRADLYRTHRQLFHFWANVPRDTPVHMLGSGILAYHTDLMQFGIQNLKPGGVDMQLALYAQQHHIPMVVLHHMAGWLKDVPALSRQRSICRNKVLDKLQMDRLSLFGAWRLYRMSPRHVPGI